MRVRMEAVLSGTAKNAKKGKTVQFARSENRMSIKYNMKNPLWEKDPQKAKIEFCKYLERRRKQLLKWKTSSDRAQGIRDELLILISAILGEDTHLLCIASLIPNDKRELFEHQLDLFDFSVCDK